MPPGYPIPARMIIDITSAVLRRQKRSFRADARLCVARLQPPLKVYGLENIPSRGPCLITMNHYSRPGFSAWWIALAVSAIIPLEMHWVMTAAWTFDKNPLARPLVPIFRGLLHMTARVYGFSLMPPMPPRPHEVRERAAAIRQVLAYARRTSQPVIGLAPEGRDYPGGILGPAPAGAGRFLALLVPLCGNIHPVGIFEEEDRLCLRLGEPYRLDLPDTNAARADTQISARVMQAIARLLPPHLQGEFAPRCGVRP